MLTFETMELEQILVGKKCYVGKPAEGAMAHSPSKLKEALVDMVKIHIKKSFSKIYWTSTSGSRFHGRLKCLTPTKPNFNQFFSAITDV